MKVYRFSFAVFVVISLLNTIFMINTHRNGIDAMGQLPAQLLTILIGIILFIVISINGLTYVFGSNEVRLKKGWEKSDTSKFFITLGLLTYNFLIIWFLAR